VSGHAPAAKSSRHVWMVGAGMNGSRSRKHPLGRENAFSRAELSGSDVEQDMPEVELVRGARGGEGEKGETPERTGVIETREKGTRRRGVVVKASSRVQNFTGAPVIVPSNKNQK